MGWDSATFRDKGTEVSSLSWDKGTTGQAKNLTKAPDGPGRAGTAKIQDEPEQPKSGTERDRAEKDILKRGNDVLKQIFAPALVKRTMGRPALFVPGCPFGPLGICKIYYSHFIFEVMYHCLNQRNTK